MTDESIQKRAPISYRPPKEQEAEFDALVAASDLSVDAFITDRVFGERRRNKAERKQLALLLASVAQISDRSMKLRSPELATVRWPLRPRSGS